MKNDFKFVKINIDKTEKQKILNKISNNICDLNLYINYITSTHKAQKHLKNIEKINANFLCCKQLFDFQNSTKNLSKNNFCACLKNIIEICADSIFLCNSFAIFSQSNSDQNICNLTNNFVEIIKNTTFLFGDCHYRY